MDVVRMQQPGPKPDHSPLPNMEVKNAWMYPFVPPYELGNMWRLSPKIYFFKSTEYLLKQNSDLFGVGIHTVEGRTMENIAREDSVKNHGVDGKYVDGRVCKHGHAYWVYRKVGKFIPWLICCKLTRKALQWSQLIHVFNTDIVNDSSFLTSHVVSYVVPEV
jgi:hypothetical protein